MLGQLGMSILGRMVMRTAAEEVVVGARGRVEIGGAEKMVAHHEPDMAAAT